MTESPQNLKELEERISRFKNQNKKEGMHIILARDYNLAIRTATEFIAPIVVSLCMGYMLDMVSKKAPIFMIVFVFFGLAAGILNIYKLYTGIDKSNQR